MKDLVVAVADIGAVNKNRFGWWSCRVQESTGNGGSDPADLVRLVAGDLNAGRPVALGFECPLWIDLPEDPRVLTQGRVGEGSRAWSAGAGCGALATGVAQTAWILRELRKLVSGGSALLDWRKFEAAAEGLFIWEAFVSGDAKVGSHEGDARAAVEAFSAALPDPTAKSKVTQRGAEVVSLIGSTMLRTGWATDQRVLDQACVVIRAEKSPESVNAKTEAVVPV